MISLTQEKPLIVSALNSAVGSDCIRSVIRLYLNSYGTEFNFLQFYIQICGEENITAVIMRYNQTIYAAVGDSSDLSELWDFLTAFSDCELICDALLSDIFPTAITCVECAVMSKFGNSSNNSTDNTGVCLFADAKKISALVTADLKAEMQTDFFLNTAHMLRHGSLQVYAYIIDREPVSVAGVSLPVDGLSFIPFVFTKEYFRGNGYSRQVLNSLCSDKSSEYQLICEEHNIKFYENCGFSQVGRCLKYCL